MVFTIHPKGIEGEIRGKSSNVAWASVQMVQSEYNSFNSKAKKSGGGIQGRHEHEVLTVMDADTCFAEDYFTAGKYHLVST